MSVSEKIAKNESKKDARSSLMASIDLEKIKNFDIEGKIPFMETLFCKRLCAAFVDIIILSFFIMAVSMIGMTVINATVATVLSFICSVAAAIIIALRDGPHGLAVFNYKSPGRAFLGLNVFDTERNKITYMMSVKRNLCLSSLFMVSAFVIIIHIFFSLNFFTSLMISMLNLIPLAWILYEAFKLYKSPDNRRPGDRWAGTMVELF